MGTEVDIKDLKEKFDTVQQIGQSLKEDKIRLESEIKTLESDYKEQLKVLLEATGALNFDEAVKIYNESKAKLEQDKIALETELNKYLDTYSEEE